MTESESKDRCVDCGESLELYLQGKPRPPCPKCGSTKRNRAVTMYEHVTVKDKIKIKAEGSKRKTDYGLLFISLSLTILAGIIGIFIFGLIGIVAGLVVGLIAFVIGFYVSEKHTWSKEYESG